MLPYFLYPLAFAGLASIPALLAIYWLRNRYRRQPVSSLMLWLDQKHTREGGTRIHRLQTPLLFFLELLALLLLVLAAAGPFVRSAHGTRPLVVVLDDSYSMLAGGADSPRRRAVAALEEELRRHPRPSVRFVLAGDRAQLLAEPARSAAEAGLVLREWKCRAPTAALDEALTLAAELGGDLALLLVLTDHPPPNEMEQGRLQWWSFGAREPNLAIVNAARTALDRGERCLWEVANLSPSPGKGTLVLEAGDPPVEFQRSVLQLAGLETRRIVADLKEGTPAVRARLDKDALEIDNEALLLPAVPKTVRIDVRIGDAVLFGLVEKAVKATRGTKLNDPRPDLIFTDQETRPEGSQAWVVHLLSEKEAEAFVGPFVMNRTHPLTEGLALQGVIWGAGKSAELPGTPIVTAGNVPLLTDTESLTGRHELRLRLRPDLSTLHNSPNWPILLANLVQWRASFTPGLSRTNVRLGEDVTLTLTSGVETVQLTGPDKQARSLPVQGRRVVVRAEDVGLYEIQAGEDSHAFAANTLRQDESDLMSCATGRWGDWLDEKSLNLEYHNIAWLLVLLALAVLTLHMILIPWSIGRKTP